MNKKVRLLLVLICIVTGVSIFAMSKVLTKDNTKKGEKKEKKYDQDNGYNVDDYITLGKYKGIEVEQEKVNITDDDVDSQIEDDLTEEVEITEPLKKEDFVNVTFTTKIDNEVVDDLSLEDYDFCIGDNDICKEFDETIIGKKCKDTYTFQVADAGKISTGNEETGEYEGKAAEVYVTINKTYNYVENELTDAYVKEKFDCENVEAYRNKVKDDLTKEAEQENRDAMMEELFEKVVENAKMNGYPQEVYDKTTEGVYDELVEEAEQYDMELEECLKEFYDMEEGQTVDEYLESYYEDLVKHELVLKAIFKKEKLELTDEKYKELLKQYVEDYDYESVEEFEEYNSEEDIRDAMETDIVYEFLADNAKITMVEPSEDDEEYYDEEDFYDEDGEDVYEDDELDEESDDEDDADSDESDSEITGDGTIRSEDE